MTEQFGGLAAHIRAPAEGHWKKGAETDKDDIVIVEVMTEEVDEKWWVKSRRGLEKRFKQEKVIVRELEVRLL